jgi:hypothetical protein
MSEKKTYKHLLSMYLDGKMGGYEEGTGNCLYEDDTGHRCVIGCLFNKKQLTDIKDRGLGSEDISDVANIIGVDNIEAVCGLGIGDLIELQKSHDMACSDLKAVRKGSKKTEFYEYLMEKIND